MLLRALCTTTALTLAACGPKCPEPTYEGKASDEAYLTLQDAEARATVDAAKAPNFQVTDGMSFSASTPPTFNWTSTLTASAAPPGRLVKPPWYRDLFISSAWAHLPPVTGVIFWLKVTVPGETCPVEVLTTRSDWTPASTTWATMSKGSGARKLSAISAYLTENRITEGPFKQSAAVSFTTTP